MSAEMALDIWKWRFSWPLRIFSASVGNDFQRPRGNQGLRHFQCPACPPPTGGRPPLDIAGRPSRRDCEAAAIATDRRLSRGRPRLRKRYARPLNPSWEAVGVKAGRSADVDHTVGDRWGREPFPDRESGRP